MMAMFWQDTRGAFRPDWVRAALMSASVSAVLVMVVSTYLARRTAKSSFALWTWGWFFFSINLAVLLVLQETPWDRLLQMLWLASTGMSFLFVLLTGLQMPDAQRKRWIFGGGAVAVMAVSYLGAYHSTRATWIAAMEFVLLAAAAANTGWMYWQQRGRATSLLAVGLMAWAAILFLLPILTLWPVARAIAYVSLAIPTLAVTIGMVVMEEVELSGRRYRDVLDATDRGIFVVDLKTLLVLDANRAAQRLVKRDLGELQQMRITELCPDLRSTKDNVLDHRAMLGTVFKPLNEVLIARKDDTLIVCEGDTHVIQWRDEPALQINVREAAPEETIGQVMRRAEKMSSLGQLVAGVAHELNNPLAVVVAYAQIMAKQEQTNPKTQAALQKIVHESERAAKIVRDLLSFARPVKPQMKVVDVNRLVANVLEVREADFRAHKTRYETQLAQDLPQTKADPLQIEQVLTNLITNALHAMSEQTPERVIAISTESAGFHIRITVADTGPGIPAAIMDKIFDPFFTTKPAGKGTGLGLSISNTIMQEHRGKIWAQSEPGHGAKFFVELLLVPCDEEKEEAPLPSALATAEGEKRKPRILVVDDEAGIRDVLTEIFVADGYEVDSASNGKEALEQIKSERYDLVVSDLGMPGMDGETLYRRVAADDPLLARRIVFLTGDTLNPKTRAFVEGTGNRWIGKPFNVTEIEQVVRGIVSPDPLRALTDTTNRVQRRYRSPREK